jgi:hypothetical protein
MWARTSADLDRSGGEGRGVATPRGHAALAQAAEERRQLARWIAMVRARQAPWRLALVSETPHVSLPDEVDLPARYRPYLWRM